MTLPPKPEFVIDFPLDPWDNLRFVFRLTYIDPVRYDAILEQGRQAAIKRISDAGGELPADPDAVKGRVDDVAGLMLTEGIAGYYTSQNSDIVEFTAEDAEACWTGGYLPDWARWQLYTAVTKLSTEGPNANPFKGATPK